MKFPQPCLRSALQGLPAALGAHVELFPHLSSPARATFYGYVSEGLFPSERATMRRMSEVNEIDHQARQHRLTEGAVDWAGFGEPIARETDALLGGTDSVLLIDERAFSKKGEASAGVARQWNGRLGKVDKTVRSGCLRPGVEANWPA